MGCLSLGYKEIADIAVDRLLDINHMPDYQAYPIIFLYRHYLEVRLKGRWTAIVYSRA